MKFRKSKKLLKLKDDTFGVLFFWVTDWGAKTLTKNK